MNEGWNCKLHHKDDKIIRAFYSFCAKFPTSTWNKNECRVIIELSYYFKKTETKWLNQTIDPYVRCDIRFCGFQNMPEATLHTSNEKFVEEYTLDKCKDKAISMLKEKMKYITSSIDSYENLNT